MENLQYITFKQLHYIISDTSLFYFDFNNAQQLLYCTSKSDCSRLQVLIILSFNSFSLLNLSLDAYFKSKQLEDLKTNLLVRRQRLKELLHKEAKQFEEELALLKNGNRPRLNQLRSVKEVMMREKMEEQKREAEEKMLQHWKINNPEFREVILKICMRFYA